MKRYLIIGVLSVSGLLASRVEARVIYANEIKARSVRGRIVQIRKLETDGWRGEIEAPVVSESVIYAKEIEANLVIAEAI